MKLTTLILPVTLAAAAITIASTLSAGGENDSDRCVNGVNKFGLACDSACEDGDRDGEGKEGREGKGHDRDGKGKEGREGRGHDRDGEGKREGACESNERRHQGDND